MHFLVILYLIKGSLLKKSREQKIKQEDCAKISYVFMNMPCNIIKKPYSQLKNYSIIAL